MTIYKKKKRKGVTGPQIPVNGPEGSEAASFSESDERARVICVLAFA